MGQYDQALKYTKIQLDIDQKSLPDIHPFRALTYSSIGKLYYHIGDFTQAMIFQRKALEIRQKLYPADHLDVIDSWAEIAVLYNKLTVR